MNKLILTTLLLLSSQAFAVTCIEVAQAERSVETIQKNMAYRKSLPPSPGELRLDPTTRLKLEIARIQNDAQSQLRLQELNNIIEHKATCTTATPN